MSEGGQSDVDALTGRGPAVCSVYLRLSVVPMTDLIFIV